MPSSHLLTSIDSSYIYIYISTLNVLQTGWISKGVNPMPVTSSLIGLLVKRGALWHKKMLQTQDVTRSCPKLVVLFLTHARSILDKSMVSYFGSNIFKLQPYINSNNLDCFCHSGLHTFALRNTKMSPQPQPPLVEALGCANPCGFPQTNGRAPGRSIHVAAVPKPVAAWLLEMGFRCSSLEFDYMENQLFI